VVVSTLEAAPVAEAEFFIEALSSRRLHLGGVVLNKVLPAYLLDGAAAEVAQRMVSDSDRLAAAVVAAHDDLGAGQQMVARVLGEVGESFLNYRVVATREAEQRSELARVPEVVASVPFFDSDIFDLSGLLGMGRTLWR